MVGQVVHCSQLRGEEGVTSSPLPAPQAIRAPQTADVCTWVQDALVQFAQRRCAGSSSGPHTCGLWALACVVPSAWDAPSSSPALVL